MSSAVREKLKVFIVSFLAELIVKVNPVLNFQKICVLWRVLKWLKSSTFALFEIGSSQKLEGCGLIIMGGGAVDVYVIMAEVLQQKCRKHHFLLVKVHIFALSSLIFLLVVVAFNCKVANQTLLESVLSGKCNSSSRKDGNKCQRCRRFTRFCDINKILTEQHQNHSTHNCCWISQKMRYLAFKTVSKKFFAFKVFPDEPSWKIENFLVQLVFLRVYWTAVRPQSPVSCMCEVQSIFFHPGIIKNCWTSSVN